MAKKEKRGRQAKATTRAGKTAGETPTKGGKPVKPLAEKPRKIAKATVAAPDEAKSLRRSAAGKQVMKASGEASAKKTKASKKAVGAARSETGAQRLRADEKARKLSKTTAGEQVKKIAAETLIEKAKTSRKPLAVKAAPSKAEAKGQRTDTKAKKPASAKARVAEKHVAREKPPKEKKPSRPATAEDKRAVGKPVKKEKRPGKSPGAKAKETRAKQKMPTEPETQPEIPKGRGGRAAAKEAAIAAKGRKQAQAVAYAGSQYWYAEDVKGQRAAEPAEDIYAIVPPEADVPAEVAREAGPAETKALDELEIADDPVRMY
jgi:hypothetical protein